MPSYHTVECSESAHALPVTTLLSVFPALPVLHLSSSHRIVCSVPQLFLSNANARTQTVCFSLSQTLAGTKKGSKKSLPSSGKQEIPLWYISNAKVSLRTHGSEVGPGQEYTLHSSGTHPSLPCTQEAPKTPASSPHFICCSSCSPVDVMWSLPSDTHTAAGSLRLG